MLERQSALRLAIAIVALCGAVACSDDVTLRQREAGLPAQPSGLATATPSSSPTTVPPPAAAPPASPVTATPRPATPTPTPRATSVATALPAPSASPSPALTHAALVATPAPTASPTPEHQATAAPTPERTAAPLPVVASPTPTPASLKTPPALSAASSNCWQNQKNGQDWASSCVLYAPNSPWNKAVTNPDSPKLFPNSDGIMASFASASGSTGIGNMWATNATSTGLSHGDGMPLPYVASSSDPLVTYLCTLYCGGSLLDSGVQFRVPAAAKPDRNADGDALFSVIEPNGDEYDCWDLGDGTPWTDGETLSAGSCSLFANVATSSGWVPGAIADDTIRTSFLSNGSTSASGAAMGATPIRASDLIGGHIYHALAGTAPCSIGFIYPATHFDTLCPGGGGGLPEGARIWSDLTDAQVNGNANLSGAEKTILVALHHYGAYLRDTGSGTVRGNFSLFFEGAQTFYSYGQQNPSFSYGQSNGWGYVSSADREVFGDAWTPNVPGGILSHLHILDTCYAAGTC